MALDIDTQSASHDDSRLHHKVDDTDMNRHEMDVDHEQDGNNNDHLGFSFSCKVKNRKAFPLKRIDSVAQHLSFSLK